ncbi:MAG: hypothetical protein ACJA16_004054, partial [Akkermansiaceae bacterium]
FDDEGISVEVEGLHDLLVVGGNEFRLAKDLLMLLAKNFSEVLW